MEGDQKPVGQRFSHVYLPRPESLPDSERARRRVAAWLAEVKDADAKAAKFLEAELGVDVAKFHNGSSIVLWRELLLGFSATDFVDSITKIFTYLREKRLTGAYQPLAAQTFLQNTRRIFEEEGLAYTIDDMGGVHSKVDAAFTAATASAINALDAKRYGNAKAEFDKGMTAFSASTPDGKEGIRGVFGAAESIFRLIFPKCPKLTSADATKHLPPALQSIYADDSIAQRASAKLTASFAAWVDACHNYRHEQGVEEPSQPPLALAIELISAGIGFVRWLASVDEALG